MLFLIVAVIFLLQFRDCSTLHHNASPFPEKAGNCSSGNCPAGLFCPEGQCECKLILNGAVTCVKDGNDQASLMVRYGYCMTFNEVEDEILVGACFSPMTNSCSLAVPGKDTVHYSVLPGQLNQACASTGRTGVLCGRCLPDHYASAYTYYMHCIPCPHPHWNWLWYIMAAYLPLTLFYFFILFFNLKTMSGHMHAATVTCQFISSHYAVRYFDTLCPVGASNTWSITALRAVFSIYGIWNLDFFRPFYSNLCLGIGVLPTLALDYAIAVYPLLLMVVSYLLITLYDRNYRVVTAVWSPFRKLFFLFKQNWNIRTSLIDSFATFFFLSNAKLFCVTYDLLVPTITHHFDGITYKNSLRLLYAPEVKYFGKEHLPFAVLAIAVTFVCFFVPVCLLAIYPFKFFQKFLNLFSFRWYILHAFMDSFLGCFKDGTQPGTRDYRIFLSVIYLLRFLVFVILAFTEPLEAYVVITFIGLCLCAVFLVLKPYKSPPSYANLIVALYILLSMLIVVSMIVIYASLFESTSFFLTLVVIACLIPLLDAVHAVIMYVFKRCDILRPLMQCWRWRRNRLNGYEELHSEVEAVPDRIRNPKDYLYSGLPSMASL